MASSVIKNQNPYRYRDEEAKTTYKVKNDIVYGLILVMTQYDIWAIHYDVNGVQVAKVTNLQSNRTLTVSHDTDNFELTLTWNNTMWGGITVYR